MFISLEVGEVVDFGAVAEARLRPTKLLLFVHSDHFADFGKMVILT